MFSATQVRRLVGSMSESDFVRKHTRVQLEEMYKALYGSYPLGLSKKGDIADCIFDFIQQHPN